MKLIIDIPEEEYQNYLKMRPAYPEGVFCYIKAIQHGIPLDDIKAEIEKKCEAFEKCNAYECANGLNWALKVIDKHKAERSE